MPQPRDRRPGRVARVAVGAGLVVAASLAIVVAGFASEGALLTRWVVGGPEEAPVVQLGLYGGGLLALAAVYGAAARSARRTPPRRALAGWLAGVSSAGLLVFTFVALLGLGFWSAARDAGAVETGFVGVLFFVALAGPAVASLISAILMTVSRHRPIVAAMPPLVLLAATGTSVLVGSLP